MISPLGLIGGIDRLGAGFETSGAGAASPMTGAAAESFAAALKNATSRTIATLENAEGASIKALQGGDIQTREVVDAIMSAEQSLTAAVAIRDKIVSAYLEISRMQI